MSLADRLASRALELVDVPSESRDEATLAAHVLGVLRDGGVDARDAGDSCVLAGVTTRGERAHSMYFIASGEVSASATFTASCA